MTKGKCTYPIWTWL